MLAEGAKLGYEHIRQAQALPANSIQCNADRPRCGSCVVRGNNCQYDTEKVDHRTKAFMELLSIIQSSPEPEAVEIFHRIRTGGDVEAILRQVKGGNHLVQLSLMLQSPIAWLCVEE